MFFPFINYEVIEEPASSEGNTLLKSNLPNDAMILVEFFADGDGSWFQVYSRNNFSSSDSRVTHGFANFNAVLAPPLEDITTVAQIARKGSDLYYDSENFNSGRTALRVHLLYLPNRDADIVV